jgi:hypothetical protein
MICARCDKPIESHEEALPVVIPGASGAGATIYVHKWLCPKAPRQTYPAGRGR